MSFSILICTWFSRLVWLNICWLICSLLGGVVFGVFPATTTLLLMTRRYLNGENRISLKAFFLCWKGEFVESNKVAWPLSLISFSLAWYLVWCLQHANQVLKLLSLALIPLLIFNGLLLCASLIQSSVLQGTTKEQWLRGFMLLRNDIALPLTFLIVFTACLMMSLVMPIFGILFIISLASLMTMAWYLDRFPEYNKLS